MECSSMLSLLQKSQGETCSTDQVILPTISQNCSKSSLTTKFCFLGNRQTALISTHSLNHESNIDLLIPPVSQVKQNTWIWTQFSTNSVCVCLFVWYSSGLYFLQCSHGNRCWWRHRRHCSCPQVYWYLWQLNHHIYVRCK